MLYVPLVDIYHILLMLKFQYFNNDGDVKNNFNALLIVLGKKIVHTITTQIEVEYLIKVSIFIVVRKIFSKYI